MIKYFFIVAFVFSSLLSFANDYVRIKIDVRTSAGEKFDDLYIGSHPDATFGVDYDLGEKEKPPFPPPGNLHCTFIWTDTLAVDSFETIHSDEVYYPVPDKKKYHYRYKLYIRKDNSYDTATVRWHNIPEYVDSAYFTDIGEILFKTDMLENQSHTIIGSGLFVDYFLFDIYFSANPSSIDMNAATGIDLYPNPANDVLFLDNKFKKSIIYDLTGKIFIEKMNTDNIDISDLKSGIYLIKLFDGKNYITKQFIKI